MRRAWVVAAAADDKGSSARLTVFDTDQRRGTKPSLDDYDAMPFYGRVEEEAP